MTRALREGDGLAQRRVRVRTAAAGLMCAALAMVGMPTAGQSAGLWSFGASMAVPRATHTATLLADGRVLVAGGWDNSQSSVTSAEVYDPSSNSWSSAGSMTYARHVHESVLLAN